MLIAPRRRVASSYDTDAQNYITAVEAADGQALETAVKDAINAFVVGCKADGIWSAIKASCILAGARTLTGALVPLVGSAPTNNGFVSGDYNRETGLVGNGSSKYLDSGRANNADPQNSQHLACWISAKTTSTFGCYMGDGTAGQPGTSYFYQYDGTQVPSASHSTELGGSSTRNPNANTLFGINRSSASSYTTLSNGSTLTVAVNSSTSTTGNIHIFGLNNASGGTIRANARISFYSIGESLTLTSLDTRTTTLMSALAAAIP
jgi:hypothetical protein